MPLENWEYIIYIGLSVFFFDALYIIWRGLRVSQEFVKYLEENHPDEFDRLAYKDADKKFFAPPWRKDTISYFIASSKENLGDPKISAFRSKLRWSLYTFIINAAAALVFFLVIAVWLEYVVWR